MTELRSSEKEGETGRRGEGASATPMLPEKPVEGQTEEIDLQSRFKTQLKG